MASTYSDLKVELIGTGEQTGTWGTTTNNNLSIALGEAITGSADVVFAGSDVTVTLTDTNAAQTARNLRLNLTGTSGGARNLILGSGCQIEKLYLINNGLADPVTVKNTTGSGVAVPAGKSMFVFNNSTNVVEVLNAAVTLEATQVNITGQGDLRLEDSAGGQYVALQAPGTLASSYTLTLPVDDGTNGQALITDGNGVLSWSTAASGDVYGPASSTTNAIPTFADTTGKLLQNNSGVTISSNTVTASGGFSTAANLTFTGTGNRILGDFSNATIASRVGFQSSTTNGGTFVYAFPNGTSNSAGYTANNSSSDPANASEMFIGVSASSASLTSGIRGTGTYLPMIFNTGGSERLRIDTSGNVGIGNTVASTINTENNSGNLVVGAGNTTEGITVYSGNTSIGALCFADGTTTTSTYAGYLQYSHASDAMAFATSATERMRIDSSGNVGIGTSSPGNTLQVSGTSYTTGKTYIGNNTNFTNVGNLGWSPAFIVEDTNGQGIAAVRNTADAYGGTINLVKSRGTLASPSAVTSGDRLGQIYFGGYDSVDYSNTGASIEAIANATWTSNSCPSDLVFSTTVSGSFVASERMRIDSSGNVGIGITPTVRLNVHNASSIGEIGRFSSAQGSGEIQLNLGFTTTNQLSMFYDIGTGNGGLSTNVGSADLIFRTTNTARMRISSGGVLVINSSAPETTISGGTPIFQVTGSGFNAIGAFTRRQNDANGPALCLAKSRNTSANSYTVVQNGDTLGAIIFIGDDGTDLDTYGAVISAQVDGTPGANDMPGRLVFSTTADGAATVTERMRIDSSGNVLVGATGVRGGVSTKMLVSSSSATNYLEVQNTSGAGASGDADVLFSSGSTGAYGLVGYSFTSNALRFFSNSSERMRIDSSGNLFVGASSAVWDEKTGIRLASSGAGTVGLGVYSASNAYTSNMIRLQTETGGSRNWQLINGRRNGGAEVFIVYGDGSIKSAAAISVGDATPTTSGAGITFPATQSASSDANTLDDYEEGTFTPTIRGGGTAGTVTYAANGQIGRYTKIGDVVRFHIFLNWTNWTGSPSGDVWVAGLPFASVAATNSYNAVSIYMDGGYTLTANNVIQAYINQNVSYIILTQYPVGGGNAAPLGYDTNASLMISGTYETA